MTTVQQDDRAQDSRLSEERRWADDAEPISTATTDASLLYIAKHWPWLTPHIREAILTLIQAAEWQATSEDRS